MKNGGKESRLESVRLYLSAKIGRACWQALQKRVIEASAAARMTREKIFLTEPAIESFLVSFPPSAPLNRALLEQLRAQRLFAWYEEAREPASLRWLHTFLPVEDRSQNALHGRLSRLREPGTYELRVLDTDTRIIGVNDRTGVTWYSPADAQNTVAFLRFSLASGQRLIPSCTP